jgi:hypothetical protein
MLIHVIVVPAIAGTTSGLQKAAAEGTGIN